ncbi:161_t:CDS:2, partial [Acaulospora morrowiae]
MATQQKKKRFSLFSTPLTVPISPNASLLSNYFSTTTPIREEKFLTQDELRKALENLERMVLAANDYCDSIDKLNKASKTFSKSLRDYGNIKGMDASLVICFQSTSQFYESYAEVQSRLNKLIQREYETLQKFWDKYSKKVTKEEKAHNDYIDDLDRQLNKITVEYDKKIKKDGKSSAESYEKYMNSVTTLNSDITRARREYEMQVSKRERNTHEIIAQIICRVIGNQNNSFEDSKKKGEPIMSKINEILPSLGASTQTSQDENEDSSIISRPAKEIAMITRKLSRRASHKVSQSIASISELQIAAMNYLSPDASKSLSAEQESLSYLRSLPPQIPAFISPDPIDIQFNQPMSAMLEETITADTDRQKESGSIKNDSPGSITPNFDTSLQPSPLAPVTVKPKKPDLVSKISIGIHEDDQPFFRDYDVNYSSDGIDGIINDKETSNVVQSLEKEQSDTKNKRLSIITGDNLSNDNTNIVHREIDQPKEETKQDGNNEKQLNPAYSFDTRYLVCSFPVDLPIRTPPYSPSTSPRQSHMYYYNPNYVNNNNNFDNERVEIERKIEPKKREHLQHIFSQSDGNIRYEGKFSDEPANDLQKDYQSDTFCSSPTSTNNEDAIDKQNGKSQKFDNHNTTPPSPLSVKSSASEGEKSRSRAAQNLSPRRAYTDYHLPTNNNKRAGPSVADLRERLLSLSNDKEKTSSTTAARSIPVSKQGHVINLLSKFDAEGSNIRQSSRSGSHSKSEDYFYRSQDSRSSDYEYNNRNYDDDIGRNNNEFKDETYAAHIQDEHTLSSPSKQEECDCHICQQITEKMNSSLDPQDDSSTFGRR